MKSFLNIIRTAAFSLILWCYAAVLTFVWFYSSRTDEGLATLRVLANFMSDLVWIPLGIALWFVLLNFFSNFMYCTVFKKEKIKYGFLSVIPAIGFVGLYCDTAFKLIIYPLVTATVILISLMIRRKSIVYVVFVALPSLVIFALFVSYYWMQFLPTIPQNTESTDLKILTYNILGNAQIESRLKAIETIKKVNPDVVFCTEFNPRSDLELFKRQLGNKYRYLISNRDKNSWSTGEAILSKYPLHFTKNKNTSKSNYLIAEMDYHGLTINLVNIHLTRAIQDDVIDSIQNFHDKAVTLSDFERINDSKKFQQAKDILTALDGFVDPVIICGDLNGTPNSREYKLFSEKYVDVYTVKGWGLGNTFGDNTMRKELQGIPYAESLIRDIIRIDYIFVSDDFEVRSARINPDAEGSDHRPVEAVVRIISFKEKSKIF